MEPEGSLPCSPDPAADPCPEMDPVRITPSYFSKIHFIIISHLHLGLLFLPMCGTYPANRILNLIVVITLSEEYEYIRVTKASHSAVFSKLLSFRPSPVQYSPQHPQSVFLS